jgi:hypothetical protein
MAQWLISRTPEEVSIIYVNLLTGQRYNCGVSEPRVSDDDLLNWILEHGRPAYGDQILLSNGSKFNYRPRAPLSN